MSCPNRDGTVSYGGCIFCSKGGSGDFAAPYEADMEHQIAYAKLQESERLHTMTARMVADTIFFMA